METTQTLVSTTQLQTSPLFLSKPHKKSVPWIRHRLPRGQCFRRCVQNHCCTNRTHPTCDPKSRWNDQNWESFWNLKENWRMLFMNNYRRRIWFFMERKHSLFHSLLPLLKHLALQSRTTSRGCLTSRKIGMVTASGPLNLGSLHRKVWLHPSPLETLNLR